MKNKSYVISTTDMEIDFLIIVDFENQKQVRQIIEDSKEKYYEEEDYMDLMFSDYVCNKLEELNIEFEMPDFEEVS